MKSVDPLEDVANLVRAGEEERLARWEEAASRSAVPISDSGDEADEFLAHLFRPSSSESDERLVQCMVAEARPLTRSRPWWRSIPLLATRRGRNDSRSRADSAAPAIAPSHRSSRVARPAARLFGAGVILAGKYRVETVLGQGGMGVLLGARHLQLDVPVAIKVLESDVAGDPHVVERFRREARAAASIKSDHVARVLDVDRLDSGSLYIVMEYLEGTDLAALLGTRGALGAREGVEYVLQACDALAEAHARGIVHRDLKPANLFLTRTRDGAPRIKVLDFGISKATASGDRELTQTASCMGTPSYMSPEQVISARSVDGRTDIWALGCVLYKLVTNSVPFRANGDQPVQHAILYVEPKPPSQVCPDVPPTLERIILRCLEKLPEDRYLTVGELVTALEAFLAETATSPSEPAVSAPPGEAGEGVASDPPPVQIDSPIDRTRHRPLTSRSIGADSSVGSVQLDGISCMATSASGGKALPDASAARRLTARKVVFGVVGLVLLAIAVTLSLTPSHRTATTAPSRPSIMSEPPATMPVLPSSSSGHPAWRSLPAPSAAPGKMACEPFCN